MGLGGGYDDEEEDEGGHGDEDYEGGGGAYLSFTMYLSVTNYLSTCHSLLGGGGDGGGGLYSDEEDDENHFGGGDDGGNDLDDLGDLSTYLTMKKSGLPEGAIRQRMSMNGLSDDQIERFFSSSVGGGEGGEGGEAAVGKFVPKPPSMPRPPVENLFGEDEVTTSFWIIFSPFT